MKAGIIFFIIWLVAMLLWGATKSTTPNLSDENIERYRAEGEPCSIPGHPLWTDC